MKFNGFLVVIMLMAGSLAAQDKTPEQLYEQGKNYMQNGEFDQAVTAFEKALKGDKNNYQYQKDLLFSLYLKRDFSKAIQLLDEVADNKLADENVYQIGGLVYKALEESKACEKFYKKGIKRFPQSGALYSEYGDLLMYMKNESGAVEQWEKGMQVAPSFPANYYYASQYYLNKGNSVWGLIYGEIFVNIETLSERTTAIKAVLWKAYFALLSNQRDFTGNNEFSRGYAQYLTKNAANTPPGAPIEMITMLRTRFVLEWYQQNAGKYPYKLFEYQQQLIREGMFESYNQWLFGPAENLATFDSWTKANAQQYQTFNNFQRNRVFKIPTGQYYNK